MTIPLPPVPNSNITESTVMSPPWQAWFNQLYVYLTQSSSGGGGVANFNSFIGTTPPLEGGGKLINNPELSIEANGINNDLLAFMPPNTLKGNATNADAEPDDLTVAQVTAMLNIQIGPTLQLSAAESVAGLKPVNFGYAPGTPERYQNNQTPGTTDMAVGLKAAFSLQNVNLRGPYLTNSVIPGVTNQTVKGLGPTVSVINAGPSFPASSVMLSWPSGSWNNVNLSGFALNGGGKAQNCIGIVGASQGSVSGITLKDLQWGGATSGQAVFTNVTYFVLDNCAGSGGMFALFLDLCFDGEVRNCIFSNGSNQSVALVNCSEVTFRKSYIFNNPGTNSFSLLLLDSSYGCEVDGVTLEAQGTGNVTTELQINSASGPGFAANNRILNCNFIGLPSTKTNSILLGPSTAYSTFFENIRSIKPVSAASVQLTNHQDTQFFNCADLSTYDPAGPFVPVTISNFVSGNSFYTTPRIEVTPAEISAGVTPNNYAYAPGHSFRYGAVGDGVTDDTAALNRLGSINVPAYIPYTSGKGYKTTSTVTFKNPTVICDGQLYAVGIVSNNGQSSGSYTATTPAVILSGVSYARGLFVEGDASAKTNNTIGIRVDGSQVTLDRCGASQCGFGCVVNGFIMQFTNCYFTFNSTGMTIWGGSVVTGINSILINGGSYGGNTDFAVNVGDTRFAASANPRGAAIRLEGFNCDGAPIQVDQVVAFSARNIYFEYSSIGTAGFILGGSGANNLRGCDIDSCFFNNMKFAVQCLNSVSGLKLGRANFYTGVTISAVKYSDMTQGAHYESGASSGSFANGQEVAYNFPGQNLSSINWGGITNDKDGLVNGVEIGVAPAFTKWFPGGVVLAPTSNTRTVNVSSSLGVYYTTPVVSIAGTMSSNQFTFTTKSQCVSFNGGDRLTGSGAASAATVILGMDYDNGIATLDTTGSGAATISQVAVSTATETIP